MLGQELHYRSSYVITSDFQRPKSLQNELVPLKHAAAQIKILQPQRVSFVSNMYLDSISNRKEI
jgi:hypothetical protein